MTPEEIESAVTALGQQFGLSRQAMREIYDLVESATSDEQRNGKRREDALERRIAELKTALRPFAASVHRNDGDVMTTHVEHAHYLFAERTMQGMQ